MPPGSAATIPRMPRPRLPGSVLVPFSKADSSAAAARRLLLSHSRALVLAADEARKAADAVIGVEGEFLSPVEVTRDVERMNSLFEDAIGAAESRVRSFECSPHFDDTTGQVATQPQSLIDGVRHTVVYDPTVLRNPRLLAVMRECVEQGEEARVTAELPFRMIVSDDRTALILSEDEGGMLMTALRDPALVDISTRLFDKVWARSIPMPGTSEDPELGKPDEETTELLLLLAAGLTDDAVARQLGVPTRTVARRVQRLCARLGAVSRFQLGVQAARTRWLEFAMPEDPIGAIPPNA